MRMNLLCLRSWIITSLNIVYLKNRMSLLTHVFNYFFSSLLSCLNTNGLLAFKASSLSPCPQYAHLSPHRRACNIDLSPANPLPFYSHIIILVNPPFWCPVLYLSLFIIISLWMIHYDPKLSFYKADVLPSQRKHSFIYER